jgi:hypothetical protein
VSGQPPTPTPTHGAPQADARTALLRTVIEALSGNAAPAGANAHPAKPGQQAREPSVFDGDTRVLVPLGEFAQRMGISPWLAYKLARSGRLPTTRPGKRELYVPMAAARRIERDGLPPEGGEVA